MPVPTPLPTATAAVLADQGLPQSLVDVFTIIGSIATAAGVIIALIFSTQGARKQRKADHRDQASKVSVHLGHRQGPTTGSLAFQMGYNTAVIINASSSPVYEVVIGGASLRAGDPEFNGGNNENYVVHLVPPGQWAVAQPRGLMRPDRRAEFQNGVERVLDAGTPRGLTITFRDGNEVTWQRNARGVLREVPGDPIELRGLVEPLPVAEIQAG